MITYECFECGWISDLDDAIDLIFAGPAARRCPECGNTELDGELDEDIA